MFRFFKVEDLQTRKKLLIAQSDIHRHTLVMHIADVREATARYKKMFTLAGVSTAAVGIGVRVAKSFFSRNESAPKRSGLFSKLLTGFTYFREAKSLIDHFRNHNGNGHDSP
jgi:hypothetical protein